MIAALIISTACDKRGGEGAIYSSILAQWTQAEGTPSSVTDKYIAVVPSDCSPEVYCAAEDLCRKIEENTGAYSELFYEHEKYKAGKDSLELIIGNCTRSRGLLKNYRSKDFGYFLNEGVVYIAGKSEEAVLSAISKFKEDIAVYADPEFFLNDSAAYFYRAQYDIGRVELNGFELCDYSIVYPKGDSDAYNVALGLSDGIAERTGYCLLVVSDREAEKSALTISVGDTTLVENALLCAENETRISPHPTGISLTAGNRFGMEAVADDFLSRLLGEGGADVTVDIPSDISYTFDIAELKVMQFSPETPILSRTEIISIYSAIYYGAPDLVRISGISEGSAGYIAANLGSSYTLVNIYEGEAGVYHLYKNSSVSLGTREGCGDTWCSARLIYSVSGIELDCWEIFAADSQDTYSAISAAEYCNDKIRASERACALIGCGFSLDRSSDFYKHLDILGRESLISSADGSVTYLYVCGAAYDVADGSHQRLEDFCECVEFTLELYKK